MTVAYGLTVAYGTWRRVYIVSQGSYQPLANDFLGNGATPKIEEYDANGAVVMRSRFGYDNLMMSYQAFRSAGRASRSPHRVFTTPSVHACKAAGSGKGQVKVYASWNGATEVQSWEVYLGNSERELRKVATAARNGFETEILVSGEGSYVMVKAGSAQTEVVRVQSC